MEELNRPNVMSILGNPGQKDVLFLPIPLENLKRNNLNIQHGNIF